MLYQQHRQLMYLPVSKYWSSIH